MFLLSTILKCSHDIFYNLLGIYPDYERLAFSFWQFFDRDSMPYKFFLPPAERIRKLKIRLRYHNNELVDFGSFDYSFMLEFLVLLPTQTRTVTSVQRQF